MEKEAPCLSSKGKNILVEVQPLWINLLTFCFVINTYRCLDVNRILGKVTCKHNTGHQNFGELI